MEWWYTVERESQSARLYLEREGVVMFFFVFQNGTSCPQTTRTELTNPRECIRFYWIVSG